MVARDHSCIIACTFALSLLSGTPRALAGVFGELPAKVREAKTEFRACTAEDVAQAKVVLGKAVEALDARLESSAHGPSWKQFLLWERLATQMASETVPDADELSAIRADSARITAIWNCPTSCVCVMPWSAT